MITIHVAFNAHLDPIWLWPWTSGLDEAIATCRSACDRLDANPDISFTQGEAWTFAMIERADPALFRRIRAHVASGRWEVVNGWWTQPDCNAPSIDGLRAQLRTGLAYVKDRFGVTPRCGFNPDSFGHCAALPGVMREFGQDRYVFMRPMANEMQLPAGLFSWRGSNATVTAFRLVEAYTGGMSGNIDIARRALEAMPPGCTHTLAMFGVGNHGGGPTERMIRQLRENRDAIPGARIEFSTVNRFFDAVAGCAMPEVAGELQQHAIGCYTVMRAVKTGVRRAEHALARASEAHPQADLGKAWQTVCAHQFHDTLGGSCLPEAYPTVIDQLGGATAAGDEELIYGVRRQVAELPPDPLPRVVLANPGARSWSGWTEVGTYVEGQWVKPWRLLGPDGSEVPYQRVHVGAAIGEWNTALRRILVRADLAPGQLLPLRCDPVPPTALVPRVSVAGGRIASDAGASLTAGLWEQTLSGPGLSLPVALHLIDEPTDTWSHGRTGYDELPQAVAQWQAPVVIEHGPLRACLRQDGVVGSSRMSAEWRVHAGDATVDLLLTVCWAETRRLLKLVVPLTGEAERLDGTPGVPVCRANDGREMPLHDAVALPGWGMVCPDVFACDATPARLRLTLLRAPLMAHHDPEPPVMPRPVIADQGEHLFRFRFHLTPRSAEALMAEAVMWQRMPLSAETTRGMPCRMFEIGGR
jgi:alpha-mannosidase